MLIVYWILKHSQTLQWPQANQWINPTNDVETTPAPVYPVLWVNGSNGTIKTPLQRFSTFDSKKAPESRVSTAVLTGEYLTWRWSTHIFWASLVCWVGDVLMSKICPETTSQSNSVCLHRHLRNARTKQLAIRIVWMAWWAWWRAHCAYHAHASCY